MIERREPSLLVDGCVLITGEVDRTTDFEHGMPPAHQAWTGSKWRARSARPRRPGPRGAPARTGPGGADRLRSRRRGQHRPARPATHRECPPCTRLLGGLHLSGPAFEPIISPTVDALTAMDPALVVPGHCTGWRAQHALAAALPDAWVAGSSGSSFRLAAA